MLSTLSPINKWLYDDNKQNIIDYYVVVVLFNLDDDDNSNEDHDAFENNKDGSDDNRIWSCLIITVDLMNINYSYWWIVRVV